MINSEEEFLHTRIWLELLKEEIQDKFRNPQNVCIMNNAELIRMETDMKAVEASLQEYRPHLP